MDHQNINSNSNSIEQKPAQASNEAAVKATKLDAAKAMHTLRYYIGRSQLRAVDAGVWSEERQFFLDKLVELGGRIAAMPKTYEQDGKGNEAIAYLHYFMGSADWYITEKDMEIEQLQAFGLANLGHGAELGYISISELIRCGAELDFHFTPASLASIRKAC